MSNTERFLPYVSAEQAQVLASFFNDGEAQILQDMSWPLREVAVLHVLYQGEHFTVKAGANYAYPVERELRAHPVYTAELATQNLVPSLVFSDKKHHVAVLTFLPGVNVEGTEKEWDPQIYREAGRILASFHAGESRPDNGFEHGMRLRTLNRIREVPEGAHELPEDIKVRAQYQLEKFSPSPVQLAPTHGDFQPRNWLWDEEASCVRVIDFGRFGFRPVSTDFARLSIQQWENHPELEEAFIEGYGSDPRSSSIRSWNIQLLADGLGTYWYATTRNYEPTFAKQGIHVARNALKNLELLDTERYP